MPDQSGPGGIEKNGDPEKFLKPEKVEKFEKIEKIEHKEKPEKIEFKEKPEKWEHKEKPEKFEHKEKPEKLEFEKYIDEQSGKGNAENQFVPPGSIDERVAVLEQSVSSLQHFIKGEQRPDLSRGALSAEPGAKKPGN